MFKNGRNFDFIILSAMVAVFVFAMTSTSSGGAQQTAKRGTMSEEQQQTALAFISSLTKGEFQESTTYFDATMKAAMPAQMVSLVWQQLNQNGKYAKTLPPRVEISGAHTIILTPAVFGTKTVDLKIVFSGSEKISGFFIVPHSDEFKDAPYVKPSTFSEEKINVGAGKWQLDGHLALPAGKGPFPAVILVHGSGPNDEDETVGPNKPFRDLSGGLASRGIAVLRYNKRTKQHASTLSTQDLKTITVKEETLQDVLEAAKVLRGDARIVSSEIFVIGHSLGGMLVPRIAAQDQELRGLIMLAGANQPLEDAMVMQVEYINSLGGSHSSDDNKFRHLLEERAKIKALTQKDAENGPLILGAYPAYWLDLREHDPLQEIGELNKPLLILQGERDYQVTADGDFERWKAAVDKTGKANQCQFKLYPGLNHLFMSGSGKCSPQEYEIPSHVDEMVIDDISKWIKNQCVRD